ncbi:hypothetical protein CCM_03681 [Cordyceps militaris CM01]|uniref:DUF3824 domain-containing protein n=1 Tax=Cordyceps militaris (strain CM01) TaxID=983644 RepID=G3JFS6_CORMM|nr:uncharacterized protein CCM_03681 [Cordyceps militaris CM01]EGX92309.1 hypothetical protein CCM_03681 [Cordyceps militaris CM01]
MAKVSGVEAKTPNVLVIYFLRDWPVVSAPLIVPVLALAVRYSPVPLRLAPVWLARGTVRNLHASPSKDIRKFFFFKAHALFIGAESSVCSLYEPAIPPRGGEMWFRFGPPRGKRRGTTKSRSGPPSITVHQPPSTAHLLPLATNRSPAPTPAVSTHPSAAPHQPSHSLLSLRLSLFASSILLHFVILVTYRSIPGFCHTHTHNSHTCRHHIRHLTSPATAMTRIYRDDDDDDRTVRGSTTITRYKVGPSKNVDRFERIEVEDDTRSRYSSGPRRVSNEFLDRTRSNVDPTERNRTMMESDREWDRRSRADDIRVERRVEESFEDSRGHDVERYRKETEYYAAEPASPPVVVRQHVPEVQKIIVQDASSSSQPFYYDRDRPEPGPIVVRDRPIVVRDREVDREVYRRGPYDDGYYYRHERREFGPGPLGPYRGDPRDPYYRRDTFARDRDWAMARTDGHRRDEYYSEDEDYYVNSGRRHKSRSRRHRSRSRSRTRSKSSDHHKLHLAEGALAGAGVTALLQSKRDEHGDLPENRGRKVLAGAALGALGTEALKRAHSAYEDRWGDRDESPNHHSRIKTGLGIAAVALAAAGAAKYFQANKIEKEEAHRGRSRTRGYASDGYYDSRSRSRSSRPHSRRRSVSKFAKAALGTAATAGVLRHLHNRSKSRGGDSRQRSKSRLRTGAKIAGAAAAAGVASKLYKNHQEKKERSRSRSRARGDAEDDRSYHRRDRSRSRSMARSLHSDAGADRELGLVEYGNGDLPPARRGYESDGERPSRRRRSRRRERDNSSSASDDGRKRSQSRLRNMAAAGASAFGIKEYKDRKDREKRERKTRERQDSQDAYDGYDEGDRRNDNRDRRNDHRDRRNDRNDRPSSPPHASGGAYYPPYPTTPAAGGPGDHQPYGNPGAAQSREYQPYVPQDYMGYAPPPPPGPPPAPIPGPMTGYPPEPPPGPPEPPGPFPSGSPPGPTAGPVGPAPHVSNRTQSADNARPSPEAAAKSVSFIPMSPKSTRTMEMHRRQQELAGDGDISTHEDGISANDPDRSVARQRPLSDITHNRPRSRGRSLDSDSDEQVEEIPARFDDQGSPLDGRSASHKRWRSLSGEFQSKPQRPGDWDVQGAWHVGGTNQEAVERLALGVTNALEGRGSWMQVLGEVLGSGVLGPNPGGQAQQLQLEEGRNQGDEEMRRRRR